MPESDVLDNQALLTIPDTDNVEAIANFIKTEVIPLAHAEKRGAKTLAYSLEQFLKMRSYADKHMERAQRNLATVNGIRTDLQKTGDKSRTLRNTAERFYSQQTNNGLRQHCTLFGLDYDSYTSEDDIIAALVDHHMAMQQS